MHRRPPVLSRPLGLLASSLLAFSMGCSSSSTPSMAPGRDAGSDVGHPAKKPDATTGMEASAGGSDAHPDVIIDPNDCVAVNAKPSEDGVGSYCSPGGGQCLHAGTGGVATLCTADFQAPAHEWFCTLPCNTTSQCGPGGGTCISAPFAQICVPASCTANLGDAASLVVDAGDAAVDAPGDATTDQDASRHDAATDAARDAETDAPHDAPRG
jgi:hypothetical protein